MGHGSKSPRKKIEKYYRYQQKHQIGWFWLAFNPFCFFLGGVDDSVFLRNEWLPGVFFVVLVTDTFLPPVFQPRPGWIFQVAQIVVKDLWMQRQISPNLQKAMVGCRVWSTPFTLQTRKHQKNTSLRHSPQVGFNGAKHFFTLAGANHLSENALPVAHTCICAVDDLHSMICANCVTYGWWMIWMFRYCLPFLEESQKLGLTKQVTRGGVHLDPYLPWALRQLKWQGLYLLKDHTTHVFMLYQLYCHEILVGRLKWTIGYTMILMMDVGSISSMMSSWVAWWVFYPHLPKEKGGILNSKRNLPPKRNTTAISPIKTWKCQDSCHFWMFQTRKATQQETTEKGGKLDLLRYVGHATLFGFRDLSPQDDTDASFGASTLWWGCRPVIHCWGDLAGRTKYII